MKKVYTLFAVFGLSVFMTGCGLNKQAEQSIKQTEQNVIKTSEFVQAKQAELTASLKDEKFAKTYGIYATQGNWVDTIKQARLESETLVSLYSRQITPHVTKGKRKNSDTVVSLCMGLDRQAARVRDNANVVAKQIKFIEDVRKTIPAKTKRALGNANQSETTMKVLANTRDTYIEDYPKQSVKITKKFNTVNAINSALQVSNSIIQKETKASTPNLLTIGDEYVKSVANFSKFAVDFPALVETYKELDSSYTNILDDMKIEYFVTIGVSYWDSYSDSAESNAVYKPIKVTEDQYVSLSRNTGSISSSTVRGIRLNPDQYSSRYNSAEYWVNDFDQVFYHKYTEINGSKVTKTDWEDVEQEEFSAYMNALGMSIFSKPYGVFEEDAVYQAHPPALAFVGDKKYGEYRSDNNGNSFWHYYGQFAFINAMLGPSYHYPSSMHSGWYGSRNTRAYYGGTSTSPAFGTRSTRVRSNPAMARSSWVKSGRVTSPPHTVRASSARQAGGSGGKGK
tara:strand:+ start:7694 stop:9220 length:1527 start_codon:yes stop_codon:yes gene_type:complete